MSAATILMAPTEVNAQIGLLILIFFVDIS